MKQLSVIHYETKPWKNGKGVTSQIAISPSHSRFPIDPFRWRISMASIDADSEFSTFPGYQRVLVVWKGAGLYLNDQELKPLQVFHFDGKDGLYARLKAGLVQDLGVIYRSEEVQVELAIHPIRSGQSIRFPVNSDETFVFAVFGITRISAAC